MGGGISRGDHRIFSLQSIAAFVLCSLILQLWHIVKVLPYSCQCPIWWPSFCTAPLTDTKTPSTNRPSSILSRKLSSHYCRRGLTQLLDVVWWTSPPALKNLKTPSGPSSEPLPSHSSKPLALFWDLGACTDRLSNRLPSILRVADTKPCL